MGAGVKDIFALKSDFSVWSAANTAYFVHFRLLNILFTGSAINLK